MQMSEWLMLTALDLGLRGATVLTGSDGYGHKLNIRSLHLFEVSDNPQEIVMIANEEETDLLFDHLQRKDVHLFYVKTPVEFGVLGKTD